MLSPKLRDVLKKKQVEEGKKVELEKGDFLALLIAGVTVFFPILLAFVALFFAFSWAWNAFFG